MRTDFGAWQCCSGAVELSETQDLMDTCQIYNYYSEKDSDTHQEEQLYLQFAERCEERERENTRACLPGSESWICWILTV